MKKYIALLLVITPFITFSQNKKSFQPGWIVTLQQDTLTGFIEYEENLQTPTSIRFKEIKNAPPQALAIENLLSFKVRYKNIYRSKSLKIDMLPRENGSLGKRKTPQFEEKKVFLELLADGEKPLYYHRDQNLKEHFFIEDEGDFVELIYVKYKSALNRTKEKKTFIKQLETILEDCEEIYRMIDKVEYNRRSMIKLIRSFNVCEPYEEILFSEIDSDWFKLGVNVSSTITHLTFRGENGSDTEVLNFKPTLGYGVGLSFDLFVPNYNPQIAFRNDILFKSYKNKATGEVVIDNDDWRKDLDSELNFSHLRWQSMVQYKFKKTYNSTFFLAGLVNSFSLSNKSNTHVVTKFYGSISEEDIPPIKSFQWYEFGFVGGFGYLHKRYVFDIKYEIGNGIGRGDGLKTSTHIIYLSAKYYLN